MHRSRDQKMEAGTKSERRTAVEVLKKTVSNRPRLVFKLLASGVLLDYLLVYAVKINDDDMCIELNTSLVYTAFAFRWILEIFNIIIFCTMFDFKTFNFKKFMAELKPKCTITYMARLLLGIAIESDEEFRHFIMFHQFLSVMLVEVVCQVMLTISLASSRKGLILSALRYVMVLHLPRLFAVIVVLLKGPNTSSSGLLTKMLRLFFFLYVYSNQFFAALWYLTAIYKETQCWNQAYKYLTNTSSDYYGSSCYVMTSQKEYNLKGNVSDYCSTNATEYEFGMYTSIHQSGILRLKSPLLMILYFSRWALQYLSSFAQGLEAGVSFWQNIFITSLIGSAVFIFFFVIGEVQSEMEKIPELSTKLREQKQWMEKKNLHDEDLQSKLRKNKRNKWPETKDVNIEDMFNNLPKDVSGKLSEQLCLEGIKKIEEFGSWREPILKELCHRLKPVFFVERTHVIREGDPIDEMIFVVQGKLWTYTKSGSAGVTHDHRSSRKEYLEAGDCHGLELVNWFEADLKTSDLPLSTITVKAATDVEAFVLMAHDLKEIVISHHGRVVPIMEESLS